MQITIHVSGDTEADLLRASEAQKMQVSEIIERLLEQTFAAPVSVPFVNSEKTKMGLHSILELDGLGAEIWKGVDAQEYVNAQRDAWNAPR